MNLIKRIIELIIISISVLIICSFFFEQSRLLKYSIVLAIVMFILELSNTLLIKYNLKKNSLKSIRIKELTKKDKDFWIVLTVTWFMLLSLWIYSKEPIWIISSIIYIIVGGRQLLFINQRTDLLLYTDEKLIISKPFRQNFISFKDIKDYEIENDRIILQINKKEVRLPKYDEVINNQIIELIKNKTMPNNKYAQ